MFDREKVIKGLEEISDYFFDIYRNDTDSYECEKAQEYSDVAIDAISLLKEQEAKTVESIQMDRSDKWGADLTGYCTSCKRPLKSRFNKRFCGECGQAVKWDG